MTRAREPAKSSKLHALVAVCVTVFVLWAAYAVLMPVALSVLLVFLLAPIVLRLERHGIPQIWAVIVTVTVASAVIAGIGWAIGTQLYSLGELLGDKATEKRIVDKASQIKGMFGGGNGIGDKIAEIGEKIDKASAKPASQPATTRAVDDAGVEGQVKQVADDPVASVTKTDVPVVATTRPAVEPTGTAEKPFYTVALPPPPTPIELLGRYSSAILEPLGTAGLVIIFTVFMLIEREALRDRMIRLMSGGNYTNTTAAIHDATGRISRYLLALSIVNGSYGLIIAIGLWIIGLTVGGLSFPSFVLWGLLCATLRFIPYVGPWVAAAFPIVLSLAVYDGFHVFLAVVAMFVIVELFSNNVMEPWLYGSSTGLSTFAILIAAVFWTWLWGPIGLLLSTPLTVCIVVLGRYTAQLEFLDVLLSDRPALPPPVRFYQRLLANDDREATEILREAAAPPEDAPDDEPPNWSRAADAVVVPAMTLARRDRRDEHLTADEEARVLSEMRDVRERLAKEDATRRAKKADGEEESPADAATPADAQPAVIAIPAHHRSEEGLLSWLGVGRALQNVALTVGSTRTLAGQWIDRVERERPRVVVVGVVPPGGLVQARFLCRRIRRRAPDVAIILAYFGKPKSFDKLLRRMRSSGAWYATTSIEQTQRQILAIIDNPRAAPDQPEPAAGDVTPPAPPAIAPGPPAEPADVPPTAGGER